MGLEGKRKLPEDHSASPPIGADLVSGTPVEISCSKVFVWETDRSHLSLTHYTAATVPKRPRNFDVHVL